MKTRAKVKKYTYIAENKHEGTVEAYNKTDITNLMRTELNKTAKEIKAQLDRMCTSITIIETENYKFYPVGKATLNQAEKENIYL